MGLIKYAIFVGIQKDPDASEVFIRVFGIITHFHDIKSTVPVKCHGDWVCNQRFGGDLFDPISSKDIEGS